MSRLGLLHLNLLLGGHVLLLLLLNLLLLLLLGHLVVLLLGLLLPLLHEVVLHLAVCLDLLSALGTDRKVWVREQERRQLVVLQRVVQELLGCLGRGLLVSVLGQILRGSGRLLVSLLLGLYLRSHLGLLLDVRGQHETSLGLGDRQGHSLRLYLRLLLGRGHLRNLRLLNERLLRGLWSLGQRRLPRGSLLNFTLFVPAEFVCILALLLFDVFLDASFNVLLKLAALSDS